MENDFSGFGDAPYRENAAFREGRFDGTSGSFFDEQAVGRIIEAEDSGYVHGIYRHLRERTAFFTVFFLARLVGGIVGRGHRDDFHRPRMGSEPARAFVQIAVESDDRSGFAESRDGAASGEELRYRGVGVFRIGVRVFEFVHEGSRNGHRARSRERFVAVFRLSEIVSGNPCSNEESRRLCRSDRFYGDESASGGYFRRNVDFLSGLGFEIERPRPGRYGSVRNVRVLSAENVHRIVPERGNEDFGSIPVDEFVTDRDGDHCEHLDRRSRDEKEFLIHGTCGYSEMDLSSALRRRSIRKPTVTNSTPQKMKKSALSIMSKNQSKYFAKTKTVTAASDRFTVNESFLETPAIIQETANATK